MGIPWDFDQAASLLKTKAVLPDTQRKWGGASIDTRTLKTGDVFFALRGNRQDGHDYLWEAFRRGASGAVIREDFFKAAREKIFRERTLFHNLIPIPDPEESLYALASGYRGEFSAVSVGITGSVGKTSTKEFLRFLLAQKYPILASQGNLNNHLGLPLTLFQLKPEHQYCVAELGASRKGEIRRLSELLRPRVGILTGVSPAHLEGFGSLDKIYEAKLELADYLKRVKGTLVLPDRDPELLHRAQKRKVPILLFGRRRSSNFRLSGVKARDGWVEFEVNEKWPFKFPGYGAFQAENALAALTAAFACGVSPGEIPAVWTGVDFPKGRFEVLHPGGEVIFVNDCYNASPYAFERALEAFEAMEGSGRKILVLGDMRELGSEAAAYHRALGRLIAAKRFQALFTVGDWIRETSLTAEREGNPPLALHFEEKTMLADFLGHFVRPGDQVLFKASRALKLEEVMSVLSRTLSFKGSPAGL